MLSELKRYYPTTKNAELADYFGVSQRTINRKAAELGLTKNKQFIANVATENGYLALIKQKQYGTHRKLEGLRP
jgi:Zn-dependent peptidase ImmA (M78 family)